MSATYIPVCLHKVPSWDLFSSTVEYCVDFIIINVNLLRALEYFIVPRYNHAVLMKFRCRLFCMLG